MNDVHLNKQTAAPQPTKYTRTEFMKLSGKALLGVGILSVIPFGHNLFTRNEASGVISDANGYGQRPYGQ